MKCKNCGKKEATWMYMPECEIDFKDILCDDCVPRGCDCNLEPKDGNWFDENIKNWIQPLDGKGRKLPCCEWERIDK